MPFETPSAARREKPHVSSKRFLSYFGTMIAVTGALVGSAEAAPEDAEAPRYSGKKLRLEKNPDLDVTMSKSEKMKNGMMASYYEGSYALPPNPDMREHRVIDINVLDEGDKDKKGDERWIECTIELMQREESKGGGEASLVLCASSGLEYEASGLHMRSPVGAYHVYGSADPEWENKGAFPVSEEDIEMYDANTMYWGIKGLEAVGQGNGEAATLLRDQFGQRIDGIRAHDPEGTRLDEKVVEEILPKKP